jgi:hypothetical protein
MAPFVRGYGDDALRQPGVESVGMEADHAAAQANVGDALLVDKRVEGAYGDPEDGTGLLVREKRGEHGVFGDRGSR